RTDEPLKAGPVLASRQRRIFLRSGSADPVRDVAQNLRQYSRRKIIGNNPSVCEKTKHHSDSGVEEHLGSKEQGYRHGRTKPVPALILWLGIANHLFEAAMEESKLDCGAGEETGKSETHNGQRIAIAP